MEGKVLGTNQITSICITSYVVAHPRLHRVTRCARPERLIVATKFQFKFD
jgi:hypothetical protein